MRAKVIKFPSPATPPGARPDYRVEDGAPPPPPPRACTRRYPFAGMEVGQSFPAPLGDRERIQSAASHMRRTRGMRFVVRRVDDFTIRIWREE